MINHSMKKRSFLLWSFTGLALALSGCSKSTAPTDGAATGSNQAAAPSDKVLKFAFVTNNASEFWRIAAAGVKKYEQESKVQVDVKMPSNGTADEQNQILENLSAQGYDGIAVSAVAPNDQVPVLNKSPKTAHHVRRSPEVESLLYIGPTTRAGRRSVLNREVAAERRKMPSSRHARRQRAAAPRRHQVRDHTVEDESSIARGNTDPPRPARRRTWNAHKD